MWTASRCYMPSRVNPTDDFAAARRWVAILLTLLLGTILIIDAVSTDYTVDPVVTGSVLGTIIALFGIDVSKRFVK